MQSTSLLPSALSAIDPDLALPTEVARALAGRGARLELGRGEDTAQRELRLDTSLMALFRDTRMEVVFETLYLRARRSLLTWIAHLLAQRGQESDPAELLQDTFVNIYRYAGGFRDTDGNSFRGWARTIAANVVRRARMRRGPVFSGLPQGHAEPQDERTGPEGLAVNDEQRQRLRGAWALLLLHYAAAFQKLSPRDREALHLVEVEGLSYQEAGDRLQVGRSNMKMIMFRSRKRIRAHILRAMQGESETLLRAVG